MRKALFLSCICFPILINAQGDDFSKDLAALKEVLQKTPSYKAQIKGERKKEYDALYEQLLSNSPANKYEQDYFVQLARLLFPIRDNHLGFYQLPDYSRFKNRDSIAAFVASPEFEKYPSAPINIDSLENILKSKPDSSIEGIYHYGPHYSVGVYKSDEREYTGVVISSEINLWKKGQVAVWLYETEPKIYKAIYAHPLTKNFIYQPIEKYRNEQLLNSFFYRSYISSPYSKYPDRVDHVHLPSNAPLFELKNISPEVQYLLVRSFQANKKTSDQSRAFYDSVKNMLTAKTLILDLRNNQGGSAREAAKYLKLIKQFAKRGKVYILQNNGTISQAEIFILSLKRKPNIFFAGQTTKGMLSYGSNYGKTVLLPGKVHQIYITDMKGSSGRLKYEDVGIDAEIPLDNGSDWIEQILKLL